MKQSGGEDIGLCAGYNFNIHPCDMLFIFYVNSDSGCVQIQ
jgi:hypothetical protein